MSQYIVNNLYSSPQKRQISPMKPSYQVIQQNTTPITLKKLTNQLPQSLSPNKITEADLWKSRCNDLETSLNQIHTDLELEKFKAKKTKELECRVDLILKQNAQLLSENDGLVKNFNQKKTESDIWKSKYENQMNTIIGQKANYELEIKKLQQENNKVKSLFDEANVEKYRDVEDVKQKTFHENNEKVELLKRTHSKNISLYEEQVRKMKEIIDEREKEINELHDKLAYTRNDGDQECIRLNDDRDKLRQKIMDMEVQMARELELQRNKMDAQFSEQVISIQSLHKQEIDTLDSEQRKLKKLIDAKNEEIQNLINQNHVQKQNFEYENQDLKIEIQNLKEKISENNIQKDEEVNELKEKLAHLHLTDIQELKNKHESFEQELNQEINKLNYVLDQKSQELDNQMKEKIIQRENYYKESDRLKHEIENLRFKYAQLEKEKEKQISEQAEHLERTNQTHENFQEQLRNQISFLDQEIQLLKGQIVKKNNEIEENAQRFRAVQINQDEEIRNQRHKIDEWKKSYEGLDYQKEKITEEMRQKQFYQEETLLKRIRNLEDNLGACENELRKQKENVALRTEECNNHVAHRQNDNYEISKLKSDIDQLEKQITYLENLKAKELIQQREKLESLNEYALDSTKQTHKNNEYVLMQQINELKTIINSRDRDIEEMNQRYQFLSKSLTDLQQSADNVQDYKRKLQLIGSEVVTTQNLYDVFVKTKNRQSAKK